MNLLDSKNGGGIVSEKHVVKNIANYIEKNHISVSQITEDIGILAEKLSTESTEDLSATEFLALCQYLDVKPEQFR